METACSCLRSSRTVPAHGRRTDGQICHSDYAQNISFKPFMYTGAGTMSCFCKSSDFYTQTMLRQSDPVRIIVLIWPNKVKSGPLFATRGRIRCPSGDLLITVHTGNYRPTGKFDVMFNASKSKCVLFRPRKSYKHTAMGTPDLSVGSSNIEFVEKWPHLGHIISLNLSDDTDISYRKQSLIGQINVRFGRLDPIVKNKLFQAYCSSHYGSELWHLICSTLSEYCSAWRRGLRRIWELPNTFRSDYLSAISYTGPIMTSCASVF